MLDINYIRENAEEIKKNCANRGVQVDVDKLLELDERRRGILTETEELRALRNKGSKTKPTEEEIAKMRQVGQEISAKEKELEAASGEYTDLLLRVPNLT